MSQPVTRITDKDFFHAPCGQPVRLECNTRKVFAQGLLISCLGHKNTIHDMPNPNPPPKCIPHQAAIMKASKTVFAGGIQVGRIGDPVGPMCTAVQEGAIGRPVFAG